MNDPGLDEPISNNAKDAENQVDDEQDEREEDEQEFLAPRQVSHANKPSAKIRLVSRADFGIQSMVVCKYSIPAHCRNIRTNGFSIQYMCSGGTLESLHPTRSRRGKWSPHR